MITMFTAILTRQVKHTRILRSRLNYMANVIISCLLQYSLVNSLKNNAKKKRNIFKNINNPISLIKF